MKNNLNKSFEGDYHDEIIDNFERAYLKAVKEGSDKFSFDAKEYETVFARQLIEYIKMNGPPSDNKPTIRHRQS